MREIALDTETTGLSPANGDRVVEIGCVEMINHVATGATFHAYLNPERDMPPGAFAVHGLSEEFLSGQPLFAEVVEDFLGFIADSPLVIHNADFDMGFLNAELTRLNYPPLDGSRAIDTVTLARRKFPGSPANLDALCRRFEIDTSHRGLHGALLDANLLARVYLELRGGQQRGLELSAATAQTPLSSSPSPSSPSAESTQQPVRPPRPHQASAAELARHRAFLDKLEDPLWPRQDKD